MSAMEKDDMVWRDLYNFQSSSSFKAVHFRRKSSGWETRSHRQNHVECYAPSCSLCGFSLQSPLHLLLPHSGVARIPSASGAAGCSTLLLLALVGDVALFNTKGNEALSAQAGSLFHWNSMGQLWHVRGDSVFSQYRVLNSSTTYIHISCHASSCGDWAARGLA